MIVVFPVNQQPQPSTLDREPDRLATAGDRHLLVTAGVLLGIGQAGFLDGIVFHQLLQWHHMFSNVATDATVAGLELNTLGDGLFHLAIWLVTLMGIFFLWRTAKQGGFLSTSSFIGSLLVGFGGFDLLEGLIDHQLLGIHHVRSVPQPLVYDIVFLIVSGLILSAGWVILRSAQPPQQD